MPNVSKYDFIQALLRKASQMEKGFIPLSKSLTQQVIFHENDLSTINTPGDTYEAAHDFDSEYANYGYFVKYYIPNFLLVRLDLSEISFENFKWDLLNGYPLISEYVYRDFSNTNINVSFPPNTDLTVVNFENVDLSKSNGENIKRIAKCILKNTNINLKLSNDSKYEQSILDGINLLGQSISYKVIRNCSFKGTELNVEVDTSDKDEFKRLLSDIKKGLFDGCLINEIPVELIKEEYSITNCDEDFDVDELVDLYIEGDITLYNKLDTFLTPPKERKRIIKN